ncbi:putative Protein kinase domain-containing protein [Seiridium cardinale]|uniref:Protein kinase domain-containing protein n=1 Tax=Seiridium cardinale TaxID=138064 RepID=A0ABR2XGX6_9PEZI
MLYVAEYKAPHKLTAPHLRAGLRLMNIFKEVVNRKTIPTAADPEARFEYYAEKLTAAAITQTYNYMIEGGLEYGILTTGETIVFLKVDWRDPATLLYHLAEPGPEAAAHPTEYHFCTAVAQYLAFTLMALGSPEEGLRSHPQEERRRAIDSLQRWAEDFETTLRSIPKNERSPPTGSTYAPTTYTKTSRSPYVFRNKTRRRHTGDDRPRNPIRRDHDTESSSDESPPGGPDSPSPSEPPSQVRRSERILAQRPRGGGAGGRGGERGRQYCTQQCLLGLVRGGPLDKQCPNVLLHRQSGLESVNHPINHNEFLRLLYRQLQKSLDDGVTKLGFGGSRGVLFQVTLIAYGYTFVCKGTVAAFIPDLQHEEMVYQQLKQRQGTNVPVFLGTVDLRKMGKIYYYDHRVYIEYMMFLSWGGKTDSSVTNKEVKQCLGAIHQAGVVHGDVRWANVLRHPQTGKVMMIDFERSVVKLIRRPLGQVVPNKRVWTHGGSMEKVGTARCEMGFRDDILAADAEFSTCEDGEWW